MLQMENSPHFKQKLKTMFLPIVILLIFRSTIIQYEKLIHFFMRLISWFCTYSNLHDPAYPVCRRAGFGATKNDGRRRCCYQYNNYCN